MDRWLFVLWGACFLLLVPLVLAAPVGYRERCWKRFGKAVALSFVGIWVPLVVFVLRVHSFPDWKGDARLGWVDCFSAGFWALLPLVLFASCGFYRVVVWKSAVVVARWCEVAIYVGALVSSACLGVGLFRFFYGAYRELACCLVIEVWERRNGRS